MTKNDSESAVYSKLGASTSKAGVLSAVGKKHRSFFAELNSDVCGNPDYYSLLHADGAGTKSILAYLAYRETGSIEFFKGLAQDSLIMNLDDIACVGAFESLSLSNTIGRNRTLINDDIIQVIVKAYADLCSQLEEHGIKIELCGGETADVGDLVRTLIVDSTLFARVKKSNAISTDAIASGDVIVGLASSGQATYESSFNSGIASNGLTAARHAMIPKKYFDKYPEIYDPKIDSKSDTPFQDIFSKRSDLNSSIIEALLSPTRTYAPIVKNLLDSGLKPKAIIHCSGGGQAKINGFGKGKRYVKENLFEVPEIFKLIQKSLDIPWSEMYTIFNMGHRLEIIVDSKDANSVIKTSESYKVAAQIIGSVSNSDTNQVVLKSQYGEFTY